MGKKEPREKDVEEAGKRNKEHYMNGDMPGVKINDRGCTDILVCLLFLVMIAVMIAITGWAFSSGDIEKIATKYDMQCNKCEGDYPKKLFTRILPRKYENSFGMPKLETGGTPDLFYYSVCVAECPMNGTKDLKWKANDDYPKDSDKLGVWTYDTEQIMGFCFPETQYLKETAETVFVAMYGQLNESMGGFGKYMVDI